MKLMAPWSKSVLTPCDTVVDIDKEVRRYMPYLIRIMRKEDGLGITLNQVGINKAVFVTNTHGDHIRIYVNPVLVSTGGGEIETNEGCLSFPDKLISRQRKRHVVIRALNLKGEQIIVDTRYKYYTPKASALLSVCLQHEMDHINGVDMREFDISTSITPQ